MPEKVLVTGGAGFIGSHLVDSLLSDGYFVRVLDDLSSGDQRNVSRNAELIVGSITDPKVVATAADDIDIIYHLAARASVEESIRHLSASHAVNLSGAINIFQAAANAGRSVPVVYASSAAVYGNNQDMPLRETAMTVPQSPYGADKLGCEVHARVATQTLGVPTIGLRFFNVYGPRQSPSSPYSGVISIFSKNIFENDPITIQGDGHQTRDFVYVGDVVRFLRAAAKHADGGVYNVGTATQTSILQLAQTLSEAAGVAADIRHVAARPGDIMRSCADCTAARETLQVSAQTDLSEGLTHTMSWMAEGNEG